LCAYAGVKASAAGKHFFHRVRATIGLGHLLAL
jgi:hypothetical protein